MKESAVASRKACEQYNTRRPMHTGTDGVVFRRIGPGLGGVGVE